MKQVSTFKKFEFTVSIYVYLAMFFQYTWKVHRLSKNTKKVCKSNDVFGGMFLVFWILF